jgi:hypothetical protein
MRGLRRKETPSGEAAADEELPRLTWPAHREGQDLIISVIPSRVAGEHSFRPVDVVAGDPGGGEGEQGDGSAFAPELADSLARAAQEPGTVAIQGFAAHPPTGRRLTFTLAMSLADIPYPEAGELPEGNVSDCRLPCGPALRIFRWAKPGDEAGAPPIPLFTTTYLAQTDYGVLALAFATPHIDGAREFAVLFEAIASTCTLQPAPSRESEAQAT